MNKEQFRLEQKVWEIAHSSLTLNQRLEIVELIQDEVNKSNLELAKFVNESFKPFKQEILEEFQIWFNQNNVYHRIIDSEIKQFLKKEKQ